MRPSIRLRRQNPAAAASSSLRRSLRFVLSGYQRALAGMAAAAFLGGLTEALFLVTITRLAFAITDRADRVGIVAGRYLSLGQTLALAALLAAFRASLAATAVWQSARTTTSVVARVRRRLTTAFLDSAWEVQQAQQGGSLQQLVGGFSQQAASVAGGVGAGIVAFANVTAMLVLAVLVDPLGSVLMLSSMAVLGMALRPIRQAVRRQAHRANRANMDLSVAVHETSRLGLELHVFHVQNQAGQRLGERIDTARDAGRRLHFANGSMGPAYTALAYTALVIALAVVSRSDAADLTSLGAVMLVMLRSLSYGQALQGAYLMSLGAVPAVDELIDKLDAFDRGKRHDAGQPVGDIGRLRVDNVSFGYTEGTPVLHEVSFDLEPGEVVGIVGPSGGGKSTLVQLLLGLRDPSQGSISASGRETATLSKSEWANKVSFVPQAAHLIAGTIGDNIRFLRPGISDEQVEHATRLAHLHDEVCGFEEGYDRQVGEEGGHLSGGQQQRLCIARALIGEPELLILDEPTSALDVRSEHLIRSTLLDLKGRTTTLIVAHRLSTLDICDRIMVIQNGRIIAFDDPRTLAESSEFYREALQLSGLR